MRAGRGFAVLMDDHPNEREANYFAMCLLIPEDMIQADCKGLFIELHGTQIKDLAERYQVSELLMTLRLADLGIIKS